MEFRLKYEGPLKSRGDAKHKFDIRRAFHPQLKALWEHPPLDIVKPQLLHANLKRVGDFRFGCLVSKKTGTRAELEILILRPEEPGGIIKSGDIDNSLKTLFDALRRPNQIQELPSDAKPSTDEDPFHCLVDDDKFIKSVKVSCDRLLEVKDESHVFLLVHVNTKPSLDTPITMSIP